jgi:hypothetical protein
MDPEDLGFDTDRLDQMYEAIIEQNIGIDSIQIVRYGYLCYDKCFEFYNYSDIHNTFSITKSILNILIGIAHSKGFIPDLDEPVFDIFSDRTIQNVDSRKQAITIRHLLKMQSGFSWNELSTPYFTTEIDENDYTFHVNTSNAYPGTWLEYYNPANDLCKLLASSDWVQFILDKPMSLDPGTEFNYNTAVSHLLSAILQNKTELDPEGFANQYLFNPLNISDYLWWQDPMGLNFGGGGLWLRPYDMLKIGYLYLNDGKWNDLQIVPKKWVLDSIKSYTSFVDGIYGYGYQWWINNENEYYYADGLKGQHIIVNPDKALIVVFTAWDSSSINLCNIYILDSIITDVSVPEPTTTVTSSSSSESTILSTTTNQTSTSSILFGIAILLIIAVINMRKRRTE